MATPDHTVLARLSELPDFLFAHLRGVSPDYEDPEEQEQFEVEGIIASMDQVKTVINCLLGDSDAFLEARLNGLDVQPAQWPLSPITFGGLLVATHLLNEYAEWLQATDE